MQLTYNQNGQALAPATKPITAEAFLPIDHTEIRWLGNAGIMINSRGTTWMIDPLLEGFDMPLLIEQPILPQDVPSLDACLVTHIDNDHFSRITCKKMKDICKAYHAPQYVAEVMRDEGLNGIGHDIGEEFFIGETKVKLTPADHNWQDGMPDYQYRRWLKEDYCGYSFETPDGSIWLPGDSRLMEAHLQMPQPDVILFDFSDNDWHITFEGAVKLANCYPNAKLICIHWGSVDAPEMTPFNGDPARLLDRVVNPDRVCVLAPGEAFQL